MPSTSATNPAAKPAFAKGDYVIYPGRGVFRIGDAEQISIGDIVTAMVTLTSYEGTDVVRVPSAKLATALTHLPDAALLAKAEAMLAGPSRGRLGSQASAGKHYAKCNTWDLLQMADGVTCLRPSIEVFPHTSYHAAEAISTTMGRIALLFHLVSGEDRAAAKERLTILARAVPAAAPPKVPPAPPHAKAEKRPAT